MAKQPSLREVLEQDGFELNTVINRFEIDTPTDYIKEIHRQARTGEILGYVVLPCVRNNEMLDIHVKYKR